MNFSVDQLIGMGIILLIAIAAIVFIAIFIKGIVDNKQYDKEALPDFDEIDVEDLTLPDVELDVSTFDTELANDSIQEESAARLLSQINKKSS